MYYETTAGPVQKKTPLIFLSIFSQNDPEH